MSRVKDTFKHASIYSTAAVLGKMVGFLMLPFYAHILRDNGYAVIGMLDAGMALLVSMLAFGVRGANVRLYHDQDDPDQKKAVISTGVIIILSVSSLLVIPLIVFSHPIAGLLLDNPEYNHLLIMALIAFVFEMGGQGSSSWLLIHSQSIKFAAINVLRLIVGLSLNIWLILIKGMGLNGYFISVLTISILANGLLMYFALRDCGTRFDRKIAIQFRDYMLPLIPGNLVAFSARQAERYLVKFQIDLSSVGILEMGYKFPVLIAQFVTTPFMQSWNTRRFEIADQADSDRQIGEMFTYYLFLVSLIGLVMAVAIKPILVVLTPPEFHPAYRIARVEIITIILNGVYFHLTFGLFYAKHTHTLAKIRGWTSAVKVALAWWFITMWGLAGAAWSAAIIGFVSVVVGFILSQRQFSIRMEWKKIFGICGLASGLFIIISQWDPSGSGAYHFLNDTLVPAVSNTISSSPLGEWKEGKLPLLLSERSAPLSEAIVKGGLGALYGFLLPLVHDGTRRKFFKKLSGN